MMLLRIAAFLLVTFSALPAGAQMIPEQERARLEEQQSKGIFPAPVTLEKDGVYDVDFRTGDMQEALKSYPVMQEGYDYFLTFVNNVPEPYRDTLTFYLSAMRNKDTGSEFLFLYVHGGTASCGRAGCYFFIYANHGDGWKVYKEMNTYRDMKFVKYGNNISLLTQDELENTVEWALEKPDAYIFADFKESLRKKQVEGMKKK